MEKRRARPSQGVYVYKRKRGTRTTWVLEHRPGAGLPKEYRSRDTKTEAEAEAARWRAELKAAAPVDPASAPRMTVDDAWQHYLVRAQLRLRVGVVETYTAGIEKHVLPAIGHVPVADLTPGHVRRLIDDLLTAGVNPKTVRNAVGVLRSVLAQLVSESVLPANAASIQRGWIPIRQSDPKSLTKTQLHDFLEAAKGEPYEVLVHFLAFTGVRLGEAVALRWSEVDLESRTAQIVRSVRLRRENAPKTRFGRRPIDLPSRLVRGMDSLPRTSELVFPATDGGFVNARHLHHVFRRISKRAGLAPVHPHMLRHTWATQMLNSGAPLNYVSRALGHHSTAFTAATYATAQPEPRHEDVDRFVGLVSGDAPRAPRNQVLEQRALPQPKPGADPDAAQPADVDQAADGADADPQPVGDLDQE